MRRADDEIVGRRPVVATLDTGCGKHAWLDGGREARTRRSTASRSATPTTAPTRRSGSTRSGALDGGIDPLAGHGTFIAGLIHQACPDADIVAWRIVGSDGPVVESDLVEALAASPSWPDGTATARRAATRSTCSACRWATTTRRRRTCSSTRRCTTSCELLGECGVSVVCSAGNDATARPMFPAAFAPWADGKGGVRPDGHGVVPVVSVGALNPNGTDALFSNAGPWVRAYAPGAAVMSTLPPFQGGLEPAARTEAYMRVARVDRPRRLHAAASRCGAARRSPLRCSPATWPPQLGRSHRPGRTTTAQRAVARAWKALAGLTDLTP